MTFSLFACGPTELAEGETECGSNICPAGQYCEDSQSCQPGCTSDNNCLASDECVTDDSPVGICEEVARVSDSGVEG